MLATFTQRHTTWYCMHMGNGELCNTTISKTVKVGAQNVLICDLSSSQALPRFAKVALECVLTCYLPCNVFNCALVT